MFTLFTGLSAFPLTPTDANGVVDTDALGVLVDLAVADVDSSGLLGSTGIYAYLDRDERARGVAAGIEAAAGRVPVIVGVGSLRTSWAIELASDAERAGASGLLLAPMSYAALNRSAARRQDTPLSTAATTRSRRSRDKTRPIHAGLLCRHGS